MNQYPAHARLLIKNLSSLMRDAKIAPADVAKLTVAWLMRLNILLQEQQQRAAQAAEDTCNLFQML